MKKTLLTIVALALCAMMAFAGCAPAAPAPAPAPAAPAPAEPAPAPAEPAPVETTQTAPASGQYELALVTDIGTIDDQSFNQGTWEGLEKYAMENNKTYKYYQPSEQTADAYISTIDLAIKGGAKLIACPGYLFEPAVYVAQDRYPDTTFILVDGFPQDGTYTDFRIEKNVYSIFYAEEQSGFLAGYAAVKDGYKKLGFMGGMAVPAVVRFGYGFVQGAEYAAKELGLKKDDIKIQYTYVGTFGPSPEIQAKAASWYKSGTEVIFACGGGICFSIFAAAEAANARVIGVDVDQSNLSTTVITSAEKGLAPSVYSAISDFYAGSFPGGKSVTMTAAENGVGLPDNYTQFKTFTKADYDAIFAKLAKNEITLMKDKDASGTKDVAVADIPVALVKVTEAK